MKSTFRAFATRAKNYFTKNNFYDLDNFDDFHWTFRVVDFRILL